MENKAQDKEFITDHLSLAVSLETAGHQLKALRGHLPRKAHFVFLETPELKETVQKFWSNQLRLPAFQLLQQLKATKDRLYAEARQGS